MEIAMGEARITTPVIEAAAVLTLKVQRHVPRAVLEEATFHVEQILGEHAADIAPGASACADFENDTIEIDMTLTGNSSAELHQQLATIIDTLDRHSALHIREGLHNHLTLTASATRVAQPHNVAA
jgi:hypothetical protein